MGLISEDFAPYNSSALFHVSSFSASNKLTALSLRSNSSLSRLCAASSSVSTFRSVPVIESKSAKGSMNLGAERSANFARANFSAEPLMPVSVDSRVSFFFSARAICLSCACLNTFPSTSTPSNSPVVSFFIIFNMSKKASSPSARATRSTSSRNFTSSSGLIFPEASALSLANFLRSSIVLKPCIGRLACSTDVSSVSPSESLWATLALASRNLIASLRISLTMISCLSSGSISSKPS
mmetsp:Transcript_55035/g.108692  ORF Transcript_55035/g.108692 Transcript_55035/m.108692 type:complete len:239 (-) Transcript_55035:1585-2301(-)